MNGGAVTFDRSPFTVPRNEMNYFLVSTQGLFRRKATFDRSRDMVLKNTQR